MKLLTTSEQIKEEVKNNFLLYKKSIIISAWGTENHYFYRVLRNNKDKIDKMIIGTHMHQTSPEFIKEFNEHSSVRFQKPQGGLFHPKLYFFYDDSEKWVCFIGSPNLTKGGFELNIEILQKTISNDIRDETQRANFFNNIHSFAEKCWDTAGIFTEEELEKYSIQHTNNKPKINSLNEKYEEQEPTKSITEAFVWNITWERFVQQVLEEKDIESHDSHSFEERLMVLNEAQTLFKKSKSFNNLTEDEKKFIGGINSTHELNELCGYFGHMQVNHVFKPNITKNEIALAIDSIPLKGEVTKTDYDNFINHFSILYDNGLSVASRILTMKRPDIFVSFNGKSKEKLCKDFGIQNSINYETYWTSIIERIQQSQWFNYQLPESASQEEKDIFSKRTAFLDSIYYEEIKK